MNDDASPIQPKDSTGSNWRPHLGALLRDLRLDVRYERAAGDELFYRGEDGKEVAVLDLVGGYGALLLGHNHPAVRAAAERFLASGAPTFVQGAACAPAGRLAAELSRRAGGGFTTVFANSGTEAVEAAMKHAMLETGGSTFIALDRGFHGKTLGALQLTGNPAHRDGFALPGGRVVRVPANSLEQLEAAAAQSGPLAGVVLEPVLGEGGVRELDREFAGRAAELCADRGVPLIADECQTGCGRTGTFLASEAWPRRADYVILSKALGGGLAKAAALLVRRGRYREAFDLRHSSTFAGDAFSCTVALAALELIDDALLKRVRETGARLRAGLEAVAEEFPGVIAEVRGRGLMLGVEFHPRLRSSSLTLRLASATGELPYLLAGHFLHAHRLRVAPLLSDPSTLRLQPSALLTEAALGRVVSAFREVAARLQENDAPALAGFLGAPGEPTETRRGGGEPTETPNREGGAIPPLPPEDVWRGKEGQPGIFQREKLERAETSRPAVRVAWVCHLVDEHDLCHLEPGFARLPAAARERLLARRAPWSQPLVMNPVDIRSARGEAARFFPILLPVTTAFVRRSLERRATELVEAMVQAAVDAARDLGCGAVSLGQFTSIATGNGSHLVAPGTGLTNGNHLALALALQAVRRVLRERGTDPAGCRLGVAGAPGNIGRACAEILAPEFGQTVLAGSPRRGTAERLAALAADLPRAEPGKLANLGRCDVVVTAINTDRPPFGPGDFAPGTLVCDLSVPGALAPGTAGAGTGVTLIPGGLAQLPGGESSGLPAFPLPPGQFFGCMAEALLLGWEGVRDNRFTGPLRADHVRWAEAAAERHGIGLAGCDAYRVPPRRRARQKQEVLGAG